MTSPSDATDHHKPVVEPSPTSADPATRALQQSIRQQEILAELGVVALQGKPFLELLSETVRLTAEGMNAEFCKVIEFIPADNRLLVRAGVGWHEGIVGRATVGVDLESPSGFALRTGKPVISNHLENEQRFRTPELLVEHGIRRAMNVILQGDGSPYGVLEVDSRSEGEFSQNDIAFLQGAANILGMAIEQQQYQRKLQAALDRHQVLLREVNHRVKNSLQVVSSMLQLQANAVGDQNLSERLTEAASRVNAVGRAYERLAYTADYENIDLIEYLRQNRAVVHGSTFGNNDLAMAAGIATLHVLESERLIEHTARSGERLSRAFAEKIPDHEFLHEVRGKGLMIGIEFGPPTSLKLKASWHALEASRKGLFCQLITIPLFKDHKILSQVASHTSHTIKLLPAFVITKADCEWMLNAFASVLVDSERVPGAIWSLGKTLVGHAMRASA
jgi:hypothetical protein